MNKEILELVTKIFTFLKLEDYTKLTNILSMIEKNSLITINFLRNLRIKVWVKKHLMFYQIFLNLLL